MATKDKRVSLKYKSQQHIIIMKKLILSESHANWLLEFIESKAKIFEMIKKIIQIS